MSVLALLLISLVEFMVLGGCDEATAEQQEHHHSLEIIIGGEGISFMADAIQRELEYRASHFKIPAISFVAKGFNITLTRARLEDFQPPEIVITLLPPDSFEVALEGGRFGVRANWRATRQLMMIDADGEVTARSRANNNDGSSDDGIRNVLVTAAVRVIGGNGNGSPLLNVTINECIVKVPVRVKVYGSVLAPIANAAHNSIEEAIEERAPKFVCQFVERSVTKAIEKVPDRVNLTERYGLAYSLKSVNIASSEITVKVEADVIANN